MSFIVYGVTKNVTNQIAKNAGIRIVFSESGEAIQEDWEKHQERIFNRKKSLPLSGEFDAPQFAKEYMELIKKSGVQHKNLCIKVKEKVIDSKTGKTAFRLKKYEG